MLGDVNKLYVFKSLLTMPSNFLPLHLNQTFLPIIWIFAEGEGDGIQSRLPFKIFSTLHLFLNPQILGNLSKMEAYTQGTSVQRWIFFYFISSSLSSNVRAQSYILNLGSPNHRVLPCDVEKTNFFLTKNSRPELIVIALMSTLYLALFDPNYNDGKCFIRKCTKYK